MTQSTDNKLIEYLKYRQRGKIYFSDDFTSIANTDSIRKSLSVLEKKGNSDSVDTRNIFISQSRCRIWSIVPIS